MRPVTRTRKMSDAHEDWLVDLLGGRKTKGSGNQWHNPMDGRHSSRTMHYAFAWDGKSTFAKSIGVSLEMWDKAKEQAGGERPLLPLRFYADERLRVRLDLVCLAAEDFAEILEDARRYQAAKESGCLVGTHTVAPADSDCVVCGADMFEAS